jgi:hypothetical protein
MYPIDCLGGDAAAIAQPRRELAIVDRAAAEGGFGQPVLAAKDGDFLNDLVVHWWWPRLGGTQRFPEVSEPSRPTIVNHKTQLGKVGDDSGLPPTIQVGARDFCRTDAGFASWATARAKVGTANAAFGHSDL